LLGPPFCLMSNAAQSPKPFLGRLGVCSRPPFPHVRHLRALFFERFNDMRSELVFVANGNVDNRFMLCHLVRVASRRFHRTGDSIQSTINRVLSLVTEQTGNGAVPDKNDHKALWEACFATPAGATPVRALHSALRTPRPLPDVLIQPAGD
jgi:hypothetical protein